MRLLLVTMMVIAAGCAIPEGAVVTAPEVTNPPPDLGKADYVGAPSSDTTESKDSQPSPWETGIDADDDGSTDPGAQKCDPEDEYTDQMYSCEAYSAPVVWQCDPATGYWFLRTYPDGDSLFSEVLSGNRAAVNKKKGCQPVSLGN